jgi:hypothetical protein
MILAAVMTRVLFFPDEQAPGRAGTRRRARVVAGTYGGSAAVEPHGLLPVSVAFDRRRGVGQVHAWETGWTATMFSEISRPDRFVQAGRGKHAAGLRLRRGRRLGAVGLRGGV